MSSNKYIDLIIYLSTDWKSSSADTKGYLFGDVPFIRALSKLPGVRILCVNQPFTPVETTIKKKTKAVSWIKGERLERLSDNLFVYTPFAFIHDMLAAYSPALQEINRAVLSRQLKKQLKSLGFNSPVRVSWIYHPLQYTYFGLVDEGFRVYKCWDIYRIREHPDKLKKIIESYEKMILSECDITFTPCISLYKKLSGTNKNVFFIPGGVDFYLFGQAFNGDSPIPEEILKINSPRIGFSGNINERVDISLIRYLAEFHPDWSIVLLGNINGSRAFLESEDYIICKKLPNVHFLGFKDFEVLYTYIKYFDVCLLAHSEVESMRYAHPYKTLQYLAAGRPVVSTDFPDAYYYKDVIKIAKSRREFATSVEEALNDGGVDAVKRRMDFAKNNTWDKRAKESYDILRNLINLST